MDNAGARRAAPTREEREHKRARWERQEQERLARFEDAERARAQQQQADLDERYRKIRKAEADRRAKWVAERDRLTVEIAEGRNVVALLGVGNTDAIPVEMAEKLRVRVWLMAAEDLVEKA